MKSNKTVMTNDTQISNEDDKDIVLPECPRCGCESHSWNICTVCGYDFSFAEEDFGETKFN